MKKSNCMIVDDEPLAIEVLSSFINRLDDFELVKTCSSGVEAMNYLRNNTVDLLLLDIQMPELTGIELIKSLRNPPKVIFTTAYREYALEGYELDVIDYLLKPIPFDRFLKAIDKYYQHSEINDFSGVDIVPAQKTDSFILLKGNRKVHRVNIDDIIMLESVKDYVTIITNDQTLTVKKQIGEMETILPQEQFIRIHRSYMVAIKHISCFTATTIEISNRELPIGRNYKQETFKALKFKGFSE